ncbi:putative cyclic bacteriocin [Staphylococcus aureus]|uniref:putative cyclic bacteriocin n=1 Tax=Staphylococcus aureus TaxID=1280 RepID=UPI000DE4796E|nr:putative cyclic bacteriocin [Staphylococcus aureus]MCE5072601.1 putative cyclic bacteriocin [Staphylococcus aureus]MCE5077224.1 putative cyclic bacteriocin [Staphylococcus aureus]
MLKLHKKIAWTGIKGSAITTFITALYNGSSVWNALAVAGIAFGGGAGTAVAALGRATVMRFIKRWGLRKTAAW